MVKANKSKKQAAKSKPKKEAENMAVAKSKLTEEERARLLAYSRKILEQPQPPKFKVSRNGGVLGLEFESKGDNERLLNDEALSRCFGTSEDRLLHVLLNQLLSIEDIDTIDSATVNQSLAFMHDMKPQDTLEAMLAMQMQATHRAMLTYSGKLLSPDSRSIEQANFYMNSITKLSRTYIAQMDALNKHRGKGQQKMTVEHVHINQGGQAIIGNVTQAGRGESVQKTVEAPHAP